ncbi:hypothetical protein Efla_006013 [Eimeria flavescens]
MNRVRSDVTVFTQSTAKWCITIMLSSPPHDVKGAAPWKSRKGLDFGVLIRGHGGYTERLALVGRRGNACGRVETPECLSGGEFCLRLTNVGFHVPTPQSTATPWRARSACTPYKREQQPGSREEEQHSNPARSALPDERESGESEEAETHRGTIRRGGASGDRSPCCRAPRRVTFPGEQAPLGTRQLVCPQSSAPGVWPNESPPSSAEKYCAKSAAEEPAAATPPPGGKGGHGSYHFAYPCYPITNWYYLTCFTRQLPSLQHSVAGAGRLPSSLPVPHSPPSAREISAPRSSVSYFCGCLSPGDVSSSSWCRSSNVPPSAAARAAWSSL